MLTYSLSDTGTDSLYVYLYKCIKNDILRGILTAGTKLGQSGDELEIFFI